MAEQTEDGSRYHGFTLRSVCWGYRDLFERVIEGLFERGLIGSGREEVTHTFFGLLRQADQNCYDHVLRRFLGAINPRTEWLLDLPAVFADVTELGRDYAAQSPHLGVTYFELLGEGKLGHTPRAVRHALSLARRLRAVDTELSLAFLKGYGTLQERLEEPEIDVYVEAGLTAFSRNREAGLAFFEGTLQSCEATIQALTRESRLQDAVPVLEGLLRALAGRAVEVQDLGSLDSDELIERGCHCVCLYRWLYLPTRLRLFPRRSLNRGWYTLATVLSAAALARRGFPLVHGHPDYPSLLELVGADALRVNAFLLTEWWRILAAARREWPGIEGLFRRAWRAEPVAASPVSEGEVLLGRLLDGGPAACPEAVARLALAAESAENLFQTAALLDDRSVQNLRHAHPDLARTLLRPVSFLPDFLFRATLSEPPADSFVFDLRQAAAKKTRNEDGENADANPQNPPEPGAGKAEDEEDPGQTIQAAYVYDEWNRDTQDYLRGHCLVHEQPVRAEVPADLPADIDGEARRVSRAFERIRPERAHRQKYLDDGDDINADRLVDFLVRRHEDSSPKVDFYEKPRIVRRDLAVLILLDASGSTAELAGSGEAIIALERRAAIILGQGLHTLGDRFAVCGFHSSGHRNCSFLVYKDFDDAWNRAAAGRVLLAAPACSTRIGPALRHAGWRMGRVPARQRLVLLITDGRPMDTGYDPNTHYAQQDVRMACQENAALGIHTFAISTEQNSLADMSAMFPRQRFVILTDMRRLPKVLPAVYTRLTL
ncbi:MAG: hypothetical protein JXR77_09245 [Lentisphaeria bacterium]|nr:hypothetical protein [Lentisphaeria bacterium]